MKIFYQSLGMVLYALLGNLIPGYGFGVFGVLARFYRALCVKLIAVESGKRLDVGRKVRFSRKLYIGTDSGIGDCAFFQGEVHLGNKVLMAPGCAFIAHNHIFENTEIPIREQGMVEAPIIVGDNVWIGYGVTVLAGVRIGSNSVIGAKSVVTRDIPENSVAAGVPARVIRKR